MNSAALRRRLVRELREQGAIRTEAVAAAFTAVPRETFVPDFAAREGLEAVYRDEVIATAFGAGGIAISSSSQPAIMAIMLEKLELEPGMRVLEIGAGTGYNAALLAELVGRSGSVTTIDVEPRIARDARSALRRSARHARVVAGDGRLGVAERAPYDRVIATASSDTVPRAWFDQLADGGLLELPLRMNASNAQVIPTLRKSGTRLVSTSVVCGGFMPLRGEGETGVPEHYPARLMASEANGALLDHIREIWGGGVASLGPAGKRRLLALALGDGRRRSLRIRADAESLLLYLTLALPRAQAVMVGPGWALGVVGRNGRSLAYLDPGSAPRRRSFTSLIAHGDGDAEEALASAVATWNDRGRPGPTDLNITVDYADGEPRIRHRWRAVRPSRGASGRRSARRA